MSKVLKKVLRLITGEAGTPSLTVPKNRPLKKLTERELLQLESEIGAKLFGELPDGHRREFFCFDDKTWIWYEEWKDQKTGKIQHTTTRYEVHEKGILKVQEGARYSFIEGEELDNLVAATTMYYEQVMRGVYGFDPYTGKRLETHHSLT
ncbi:MAG TPA: hypothetical protein VFT59_01195 [Candidatus Saccharimonadales bacterium]|nr:hypothetical protein [Candidatus Saccharimonadales bacterium]